MIKVPSMSNYPDPVTEDDILYKLRDLSPGYGDVIAEAVSEIEHLRVEIKKLGAEIEKLRGVSQEQLACDCGAPTEGKWADKHTVGCASLNMTCPFCGGVQVET